MKELVHKKSRLKALFTAALFSFSVMTPNASQAQNIEYRLYSDDSYPGYYIALKEMQDLYLDNNWYWDGKDWYNSPLIGIGEANLDGDSVLEIIAYPTEDTEEIDTVCRNDDECPHYILQVTDKGVVNLGTIFAYTITPDDGIKNGFFQLRVYDKHPNVDPYHHVIYHYDKKKEQYVPSP